MKAIRIINQYGAERGENGLPKFLPGLNIIFGLLHETKETHKKNMESLHQIIDEGLMLRRINIRQVAVLPNTFLEQHGAHKYLMKNKKYYWKWRNEIRQTIDNHQELSFVMCGQKCMMARPLFAGRWGPIRW